MVQCLRLIYKIVLFEFPNYTHVYNENPEDRQTCHIWMLIKLSRNNHEKGPLTTKELSMSEYTCLKVTREYTFLKIMIGMCACVNGGGEKNSNSDDIKCLMYRNVYRQGIASLIETYPCPMAHILALCEKK